MSRPDRCPVFTDGGNETQAFESLQRGPGAHSPGEKLRLPFGHRALDARRCFDSTALKVIAGQLGAIEVSTQQDRIGQHKRQWPMVIEGGATDGQGGGWIHIRHFAGLA
ncbi:hypothetical protein D3C84_939590 [compost metagenome]